MAAAGVGQQLVEQVAAAGMVPQVMVRIADRQRGLEDVFHQRAPAAPEWMAALPRFHATACRTREIRQPWGVRTSVWV